MNSKTKKEVVLKEVVCEQLYHCWSVKSCSTAQSLPVWKALLCKSANHCKCPLWKQNKKIKVQHLLVLQVCGSYRKM